MKSKYTILAIFAALILQSCLRTAEIRVQNNISSVKIQNVEWGDRLITYELLPGQVSEKEKIEKNAWDFPISNRITFTMTANNKSVYLTTDVIYTLDKDDDILIVLNDSTKIHNPNN